MTFPRQKRIQELFDSAEKDLVEALGLPLEERQRKQLLDSALKSFEETVRINPQFVLGFRKIAFIHEQRNDEQEAIKALERILEFHPHDETALLKIRKFQKTLEEPEETAQLELPMRYEEVQQLLRKYKEISPDLEISASIIWEGIGKPSLDQEEQIVLLFKNIDMTINRITVHDGTLIATTRRIILEGKRTHGSQVGSAVARHYEQRRGRIRKNGLTWLDSFIGLSLPYEEIDNAKLLWFDQVPTLHLEFQGDGHAGISGIPLAMIDQLEKTLSHHGVSFAQEAMKICISWLILLLPLSSILSLLLFM